MALDDFQISVLHSDDTKVTCPELSVTGIDRQASGFGTWNFPFKICFFLPGSRELLLF